MNERGDMLRVATTVPDGQGRRAIGTYIPAIEPDGRPNPVVATVVRGDSCMPGMIDAFGHLGLEGSRKVPATDYALATIVQPGDAVAARELAAGYAAR